MANRRTSSSSACGQPIGEVDGDGRGLAGAARGRSLARHGRDERPAHAEQRCRAGRDRGAARPRRPGRRGREAAGQGALRTRPGRSTWSARRVPQRHGRRAGARPRTRCARAVVGRGHHRCPTGASGQVVRREGHQPQLVALLELALVAPRRPPRTWPRPVPSTSPLAASSDRGRRRAKMRRRTSVTQPSARTRWPTVTGALNSTAIRAVTPQQSCCDEGPAHDLVEDRGDDPAVDRARPSPRWPAVRTSSVQPLPLADVQREVQAVVVEVAAGEAVVRRHLDAVHARRRRRGAAVRRVPHGSDVKVARPCGPRS